MTIDTDKLEKQLKNVFIGYILLFMIGAFYWISAGVGRYISKEVGGIPVYINKEIQYFLIGLVFITIIVLICLYIGRAFRKGVS